MWFAITTFILMTTLALLCFHSNFTAKWHFWYALFILVGSTVLCSPSGKAGNTGTAFAACLQLTEQANSNDAPHSGPVAMAFCCQAHMVALFRCKLKKKSIWTVLVSNAFAILSNSYHERRSKSERPVTTPAHRDVVDYDDQAFLCNGGNMGGMVKSKESRLAEHAASRAVAEYRNKSQLYWRLREALISRCSEPFEKYSLELPISKFEATLAKESDLPRTSKEGCQNCLRCISCCD